MFSLAVFVAGADTLGYLVAAFLYLRVWNRMREYLFAALALAFVCFAASELSLVVGYVRGEATVMVEMFRLAGFALLVAAVVAKCLETGTSNP